MIQTISNYYSKSITWWKLVFKSCGFRVLF